MIPMPTGIEDDETKHKIDIIDIPYIPTGKRGNKISVSVNKGEKNSTSDPKGQGIPAIVEQVAFC